MALLLVREIDVAEAMIYNEYAQVLEATNPETGELYQPEDLNVINWNDERHGDAPGRALRPRGVARRGGQRGHRDAVPAGVVPGLDLLPRQPGGLHPVHRRRRLASSRAGHQAWMMNEINPLIWPSPAGIGHDGPGRCGSRRSTCRSRPAIIPAAPPADAYRTDLAEAALASWPTRDTKGETFVKGTVEVTPGGN